MAEPVILFIVEGEDRDYRFVGEMASCFFSKGKYKSVVIRLPAAQNIYMLYQLLKKDDFESDIVEVLRESVEGADALLRGIRRQSVDEIYLIFDYDIHQNNLPHSLHSDSPDAVITRMLDVFDNETEHGKLYISYPMVEALYDFRDGVCEAFHNCFLPLEDVGDYKNFSGTGNPKAGLRFGIHAWKSVLNVFALRIKCLFDMEVLNYSTYRKSVTPATIYHAEYHMLQSNGHMLVLSAFPELLFDYFPERFWKSMVHMTNFKFDVCPKRLYYAQQNAMQAENAAL